MTSEEIEDRRAAEAFDGPSTAEERLRYRIGGAACDLYALSQRQTPAFELVQATCDAMKLVVRLAKRSDSR